MATNSAEAEAISVPAADRSAYSVYTNAAAHDAATLLSQVQHWLPLALLYRDEARVHAYLHRLSVLIELRRPEVLTQSVRGGLATMLLRYVEGEWDRLSLSLRTRLLSVLASLLHREKDLDLAVDWRLWFGRLAATHLQPSAKLRPDAPPALLEEHQNTLVLLLSRMNRYLVATPRPNAASRRADEPPIDSVAADLLDILTPFLTPGDNRVIAAQALLCLLLPVRVYRQPAPSAPSGSLPGCTLLSLRRALHEVLPLCGALTDLSPWLFDQRLELLSRMAKHGVGVVDEVGVELLQPFLRAHGAQLFAAFLQSLSLDVGNHSSFNRIRSIDAYANLTPWAAMGQAGSITSHFAKFIVFTLHHRSGLADGEQDRHAGVPDLLESLLAALRPHILSGQNSPIGIFLQHLAEQYARRVGREVRGEVDYDARFFLDASDVRFVLSLHSLLLQGLYAESSDVVTSCETALRHLATLQPHVVLPPLLDSITQALSNLDFSERTMSGLQTLVSIAPIAFNAELWPSTAGGAPYLSNLLTLALPSIDPQDHDKTTLGLSFFSFLFYVVPLLKADEVESGSKRALVLPDESGLTPAARFALRLQSPSARSYSAALESARKCTEGLEEFAASFVDALVRLMLATDYSKENDTTVSLAGLLHKTWLSFFSACSADLFQSLCERLVKRMTREHHPSSQKFWGVCVHAMSLSHTEATLRVLVPPLLSKLINAQGELHALAPSELEWILYLLGQACKQGGGATKCADAEAAGLKGNLILPFVPSLQRAYLLTCGHEKKSVRKHSRKMLRHVLRGLTSTYPAEWRNFSPIEHWARLGRSEDAWRPWKHWGTYTPHSDPRKGVPDVDCIWHVPTDEEREAAEGILLAALKQPLQLVVDWIEGKLPVAAASTSGDAIASNSMSDNSNGSSGSSNGSNGAPSSAPVIKDESPLEVAFATLVSVLRGVQSLLGGVEGEVFYPHPIDPDDMEQVYTSAGSDGATRCPLQPFQPTQRIKPLGGVLIEQIIQRVCTASMRAKQPVRHLRTYLIRLIAEAFGRCCELARSGPASGQVSMAEHSQLVKLSAQAMLHFGAPNEADLNRSRRHTAYLRRRLRDWLSGVRCRLRPLLIQALVDAHDARELALSMHEPYTRDVHALFEQLHEAAVNDFIKIRHKAIDCLLDSLVRWPVGAEGVQTFMVGVLRNEDGSRSDDALIGSIDVLSDNIMCEWISRKWSRMELIVRALVERGQECSKDDETQLEVQSLYETIAPWIQMRELTLSLVQTDINQVAEPLRAVFDAEKVAVRNATIERFNRLISHRYLGLVTFLHQQCTKHEATLVHSSSSSSTSSSSPPPDAQMNESPDAEVEQSPAPEPEPEPEPEAEANGGGDGEDADGDSNMHDDSSSPSPAAAAPESAAPGTQLPHWRFSLMAASFYWALSRPDRYATAHALVGTSSSAYASYDRMVEFFVRGSTSSLVPMRLVSFIALNKILSTHHSWARGIMQAEAESMLGSDPERAMEQMDQGETSPTHPASSVARSGGVLALTPISTEEEQCATVFYDHIYSSGMVCDARDTAVGKYFPRSKQLSDATPEHFLPLCYFTPNCLADPLKYPFKTLYHAPHAVPIPLSRDSLDSLYEFFTSNRHRQLRALVSGFESNHPTLAARHEGSQEGYVMSGSGDQMVMIVANEIRPSSNYHSNVTRFGRSSNAFVHTHTRIIRSLVELWPQLLTGPDSAEHGLVSIIRDLLSKLEEPDKACTAAELLCGSLLAIKHFPVKLQSQVRDVLFPLLSQALQSVPPESVDHFLDAIRRVYSNSDPRRWAWLNELLLRNAFGSVPPAKDVEREVAAAMASTPSVLDPLGTAPTDGFNLSSPSPTVVPQPSPSPPPSSSTSPASSALQSNTAWKHVRFAGLLLLECPYRQRVLMQWILSEIKNRHLLAQPFKSIRDELSSLAAHAMRSQLQMAFSKRTPENNYTRDAFLVSSPLFNQFVHYLCTQLDAMQAMYREDKQRARASGTQSADGSLPVSATPLAPSSSPPPVASFKVLAKHFTTFVVNWLWNSRHVNDAAYVSVSLQALLPHALWIAQHPDPDVGQSAKVLVEGLAWVAAKGPALRTGSDAANGNDADQAMETDDGEIPLVDTLPLLSSRPYRTPLSSPSLVIDSVLDSLSRTLQSSGGAWHLRLESARYLSVWLAQHSLQWSASQVDRIESLLLQLLVDTQVEVRLEASAAFQSFVATVFPLQTPSTRQQWEAKEAARVRQSDEEGGTASALVLDPHPRVVALIARLQQLVQSTGGVRAKLDGLALARRHGAILGLTSLVLLHPHDVPSHLPSLLSFLASYIEDRSGSVTAALRKMFASFRDTHREQWALFSLQFQPEQLEQLMSMQLAPSYFA